MCFIVIFLKQINIKNCVGFYMNFFFRKKKVLTLLMFVFGLIFLAFFMISFKVNVYSILNLKNFWFALTGFVLQFVSLALLSWRFWFFLLSIKKIPFSFSKLFQIEFANKFVYYVFPSRINVAAKAFFIDKLYVTGKKNALAVTTFEYTFDTVILLLLSFFGISFFSNVLPQSYLFQILFLGSIIFFGLTTYFLIPEKIFLFAGNTLKKIPFFGGILGKLTNFFCSARKIWKKIAFTKNFLPAMLLVLVYWILKVYSIHFFFLAYNEVPPNFIEIIVVYALALTLSGIPQVPGGIGVREAAFGFLFSLTGTTIEAGIAVSLLLRFFSVIPVFLGYFFALKLGLTKKTFYL